jgi:hypothetical protein
MKYFFRVVVIFCVVMLLLCGGAVALGRTQPTKDLIPGFDTCDGVPCYWGIIPGKTTETEADTIIRGIPGFHVVVPLRTYTISDTQILFSETPDNTIALIDVHPQNLTVQDVIAALGYPCEVRFGPMWLNLDYSGLTFVIQDVVLRATTPVTAFQINPQISSCEHLDVVGVIDRCTLYYDEVSYNDGYSWCGFITYVYVPIEQQGP